MITANYGSLSDLQDGVGAPFLCTETLVGAEKSVLDSEEPFYAVSPDGKWSATVTVSGGVLTSVDPPGEPIAEPLPEPPTPVVLSAGETT